MAATRRNTPSSWTTVEEHNIRKFVPRVRSFSQHQVVCLASREPTSSAPLLQPENTHMAAPTLPNSGSPLPDASLHLSLDSAFRSLSQTLHSLAFFLSQEEFRPRMRLESCSAHLQFDPTHGMSELRECEFGALPHKSNADRLKSVSIAGSNDRGREPMFDANLNSDSGNFLFVGVREYRDSAERVHDSAFPFFRSRKVNVASKQKEQPPFVQEGSLPLSYQSVGAGTFPLKEGELDCAHGSDRDRDRDRHYANRDSATTEKEPAEGWIGKTALASVEAKAMMKDISVLERAQIGAGAGGIAGVITYACLHPLDTVKTKLQTRGASDLYSGPLDVIVKTFKARGVLGFYSGISAVLVGSMFSSAVYFGTCELGKALLSQVPSFPPIAVPPVAGAMGNLVSSAILVPKEAITQRMQAGAAGRSWEVLMRTVEKEGFGGLYTGYSAALVRNLPASVLSFSSFEYLKAAWLRESGKNRLEPWQSVTSGALAGAISAALTTPLDVVKTRLMTQARNMTTGTGGGSITPKTVFAEAERQAKITAATYEGISSTIKKIWLEEGWIGFTRGVLPRILYSVCFSVLGYSAFETARLALVKHHIAKQKKMLSLLNKQVVASHSVS